MEKSRADLAVGYFNDGYNCAQSVVMAYADAIGLTCEQAEKLASGFGGGMAGMRGTCGAFSGLVAVYGAFRSYDRHDPKDKAAYYREIREMADEFVARVGALDCKTLLVNASLSVRTEPEARTDDYYTRRPCASFVRAAAEILDGKSAAMRDASL